MTAPTPERTERLHAIQMRLRDRWKAALDAKDYAAAKVAATRLNKISVSYWNSK